MTKEEKKELKNILKELYWGRLLSLREVAKHPKIQRFGIKTGQQIYYYLNVFHIPIRNRENWWRVIRRNLKKEGGE